MDCYFRGIFDTDMYELYLNLYSTVFVGFNHSIEYIELVDDKDQINRIYEYFYIEKLELTDNMLSIINSVLDHL
jgi:hypothetical protein